MNRTCGSKWRKLNIWRLCLIATYVTICIGKVIFRTQTSKSKNSYWIWFLWGPWKRTVSCALGRQGELIREGSLKRNKNYFWIPKWFKMRNWSYKENEEWDHVFFRSRKFGGLLSQGYPSIFKIAKHSTLIGRKRKTHLSLNWTVKSLYNITYATKGKTHHSQQNIEKKPLPEIRICSFTWV